MGEHHCIIGVVRGDLSGIELRASARLVWLHRQFVRTSFSAMLMVIAMVPAAFAGAPDSIKQRFEFQESYAPKLGAQELPGGSKSWTEADRAEFLRQVDRAYDIAPSLLKGVVLYRKVRVYRAKSPQFANMVSMVRTHELIVPDWFLNPPAHIAKERRDTEILGILIHELVHLFEPFGSVSYDAKWQALVAPRINKVRNHFLAKGMSVDEARVSAKTPTEHDPIAQEEGLPSLWAAFSLLESLAEIARTMVVSKHIEIPSDMQAFVNRAILQKTVKKEPAKDLAHQAMTALEKGDSKLAQTLFDKAEKAGANWVGLNISRGDMWRTMKPAGGKVPLWLDAAANAVNAIVYYTRAIKVAGSDGTDALVARGRVNLALGTQNSFKDAAEDFSAYLAVHPSDPNALFGRANAYKGIREWHKALADLDKLVSRKIENAKIYQSRAEVRAALNDADGVIEDASKAIGFKGGANAQLYELRGRVLRANKRYDEALADFTKAIALKKDFIAAYMGRGVAYFQSRRFEEAAADYETAVKLSPKWFTPYTYLGDARFEQKKWDQAEAAYGRALELAGNSERKDTIFYWRGKSRYNNGKVQEALQDFDSAIALKPDSIAALTERGNALLKLEKYDRAIGDYTQALKFNPKYAMAYNNRGIAYRSKGDNDRAIEDYTQALEINPKYAFAYYNRGLAHRNKGDNDRAIEDYTQAIEINPKYATAYNSRAWAHYKLGQFEQGLADANTSISLNPKSAYAYDTRAQIEEALGKSDEAIKDFRQALSLKPDLEMSREGLKRLGAQP